MIKITVDTEEELNHVRRILLTEACSHTNTRNCTVHSSVDCAECVDKYWDKKALLYTKEIVEIPAPIVV